MTKLHFLIQNFGLFLVDLAEKRFTEDWIDRFELYFEFAIVTPGSFDELLDERVTSPIVVGFKIEALSASANAPCFFVRLDVSDVDKSCKSTCTVGLEDCSVAPG